MRDDLRATAVLSAAAFFVMMGVSIISPVLPLYALSFGISYALVGLLIAAFAIARVVLDIPAGMVASRFGMRRFMLAGLFIIAISSLVAGLAPNFETLLAARILEGVGSAMYTTTSLTMVSMLAPREARGRHLSLYMSMFLLGSVSGPAVGGVVAGSFGLAAPFLAYGLCGAVSFVMVALWIGEPPAVPGEAKQAITLKQLGRLLKRYDIVSINLGTFAVFVTRQGIMGTIIPLYAFNNLSMDEVDLGIVLTLSAVANLSTMLLAGRLTDTYGRKPFMLSSLLITGVLITLFPLAGDMVALALILVALGLALGLTGPIAAWITDVTEPRELGGAMGLFRTIGDLGFVIAPIALAALAGNVGAPVSSLPFVIAGLVIIAISLPLIRTSDPIARQGRGSA